jgi:adenylyltransferase/sulfurtransferase
MGPIVGTIGSLQALETIKILAQTGTSLSGRMLVFDGLDFQSRIIKLRQKQTSCQMCSCLLDDKSNLQAIKSKLNSFDYSLFCGGISNYNDKSLNVSILDPTSQRLTCAQFSQIFKADADLLIDIRPECQFKICSLPFSGIVNLPYDEFSSDQDAYLKQIEDLARGKSSIFVLCRRGNDSQYVVEEISKQLKIKGVRDIIGGIQEWSSSVDQNFPKY